MGEWDVLKKMFSKQSNYGVLDDINNKTYLWKDFQSKKDQKHSTLLQALGYWVPWSRKLEYLNDMVELLNDGLEILTTG